MPKKEITLNATKRDTKKEKANSLRKKGLIPAVVYGKKKDSLSLSVKANDLKKVYKEAGQSTIFDLDIDGNKKKVLIHDISYHPVSDEVIHVDFYEVSMTEKITANVPLKFVGNAPAVLDLGGTLIENKTEVEVECLPADLPHEIEVDISPLTDFEKTIHISDIKLPEGVEIKNDPEETVVTVEPPRSEEELAELEEPVEGEMPEAEEGEEAEESKEEDQEGAEESEAEVSEPEEKKE